MKILNFKNKYNRMLIYLLIFVIILYIFSAFTGGSFGLRDKTHGCIGLVLPYETVNKYFPEGDVRINLLNFRYFVPEKAEIQKDAERDCSTGEWCIPPKYSFVTQKTNFCLGQDVWIGE